MPVDAHDRRRPRPRSDRSPAARAAARTGPNGTRWMRGTPFGTTSARTSGIVDVGFERAGRSGVPVGHARRPSGRATAMRDLVRVRDVEVQRVVDLDRVAGALHADDAAGWPWTRIGDVLDRLAREERRARGRTAPAPVRRSRFAAPDSRRSRRCPVALPVTLCRPSNRPAETAASRRKTGNAPARPQLSHSSATSGHFSESHRRPSRGQHRGSRARRRPPPGAHRRAAAEPSRRAISSWPPEPM